MTDTRIGKLTPRYSFMLNQYPEERLSKCPRCGKPTHQRKFPLFIHIEDWGPMVLGKTCKYCAKCELIIAHKHELEAELAYVFSRIAAEKIGNEYLVIGTVDKNMWEEGVKGGKPELEETLKKIADFKNVYNLTIEPGGWYPADDKNKK